MQWICHICGKEALYRTDGVNFCTEHWWIRQSQVKPLPPEEIHERNKKWNRDHESRRDAI
jgi:hypothetical protein